MKREREREREREYLYKYKREERKQFQSVAYFLLLFQADIGRRVLLKFFFRKNLLSQTTTEQQHQYSYRTIAFRRDNIIHFTRKSNQNQSCLRSTTRW